MLAEHTLTSVHNRPNGTKKAKDRETINTFANASGTIKLTLMLIGSLKICVVFVISTRRCCRLSTEIKQMLGLTVMFSKNGFLTALFPKQIKNWDNLEKKKLPFCSLTIALPIQVRTNIYQLMAKLLPSFCLQMLLHSYNQWIKVCSNLSKGFIECRFWEILYCDQPSPYRTYWKELT